MNLLNDLECIDEEEIEEGNSIKFASKMREINGAKTAQVDVMTKKLSNISKRKEPHTGPRGTLENSKASKKRLYSLNSFN
jgi:hypothetical protein